MVASDNGSPARSATVVAKINILRNFFAPVFNPSIQRATIQETQDFGIPIITVTATDNDRLVCISNHNNVHII